MAQAFQVASTFTPQAEKPIRDKWYRRFIASLPCLVCGTRRNVDPCHTGSHGIGTKSSDLNCIPLCRKHHDEFDEDPKLFAILHGLDIRALIARYNATWLQLQRRKAG